MNEYAKTAGQIGLDCVLWSAVAVLGVALFIPSAARFEWLSVAPLVVGAVVAVVIFARRRIGGCSST